MHNFYFLCQREIDGIVVALLSPRVSLLIILCIVSICGNVLYVMTLMTAPPVANAPSLYTVTTGAIMAVQRAAAVLEYIYGRLMV
jgi:hypothetical protein